MPQTIRQKILKQRGIVFAPQTKAILTHDESDVKFSKSPLMRYLELKYSQSIEDILSSGSNYELESRLGVDFTTISKWRKLIRLSKQSQIGLLV